MPLECTAITWPQWAIADWSIVRDWRHWQSDSIMMKITGLLSGDIVEARVILVLATSLSWCKFNPGPKYHSSIHGCRFMMSLCLCVSSINKHLIKCCRDLYLPGFSDHISTHLECGLFGWWMKTEVLWIDQCLPVVVSHMESCAVRYYHGHGWPHTIVDARFVRPTITWRRIWGIVTDGCVVWQSSSRGIQYWVRGTWQDSPIALVTIVLTMEFTLSGLTMTVII